MTHRDGWGETLAGTYDADDADVFSPEVLGPTITFLAELAAGRPVLEFAAGTGRVTLPPGEFGLVYLVYNTISNLLTQDEQAACFANAATHLRPGGHLVVEVFVPQLRRLPLGERFVPFHDGDRHMGVDEYDVVEQRLVSHHAIPGRRCVTSQHRYAWPAEFDSMARLAGIERRGCWADQQRTPFTADRTSHVSV